MTELNKKVNKDDKALPQEVEMVGDTWVEWKIIGAIILLVLIGLATLDVATRL